MIIPLRRADGAGDVARLAWWSAVCDRCHRREPLGECATWLIGRSTAARVYCPPCIDALAAELTDTTGPDGGGR